MIKKTLFLLLLGCSLMFSQSLGDIPRGIFLSFGVGPRVPVFSFSEKSVVGIGGNIEISYTDIDILPVFLYGRIGFDQFYGSQEFYQTSDHTHYSENYVPITAGAKYFFSPISPNSLIMPFAEVSASLVVYQEFHDFKASAGRNNYLIDGLSYGFSAGGGVSMFLMELLASFNVYHDHTFFSADLKVRIPLYVAF